MQIDTACNDEVAQVDLSGDNTIRVTHNRGEVNNEEQPCQNCLCG